MQTEQIHVLNHNERKGEDWARKEFLSPTVIYYLLFQVGAFVVVLNCYEFVTLVLLFHFSITYVSNLFFGFIGFRVATSLGRAADSVCHVSFGCGSFCAVRLSLVILWAGFGI